MWSHGHWHPIVAIGLSSPIPVCIFGIRALISVNGDNTAAFSHPPAFALQNKLITEWLKI
jgi:hypothetical protein